MYAIVEISGKQYRVEKDKTIEVDRLGVGADTMTIDKVLLCANGDTVMVGQPYLSNVKISATVLGGIKGKKVVGVKFKKRKNYTRTKGERAELTRLKIGEIAVQ